MSLSKIDNIAKPLHWPVKDEIGHLIEDYNKLMHELKIRTEQLIKSEKEELGKNGQTDSSRNKESTYSDET